jgi:hypothetical protein
LQNFVNCRALLLFRGQPQESFPRQAWRLRLFRFNVVCLSTQAVYLALQGFQPFNRALASAVNIVLVLVKQISHLAYFGWV